jgi:hypothetical protein
VLNTALGALEPVLQVTGASVGGAQVTATSATCDVPSIVQ